MPLVGWLRDDLGEDVRLPAQLMSNQVTPPETEEVEVLAMVPADASREGCWKSRFGTGYLHALGIITWSAPINVSE